MSAVRLMDRIGLPAPKDWRPEVGTWVIVPARHSGRAWSGLVEVVTDDMFDAVVHVRVPRFKNSVQIWRVSDVRPHPKVYGDYDMAEYVTETVKYIFGDGYRYMVGSADEGIIQIQCQEWSESERMYKNEGNAFSFRSDMIDTLFKAITAVAENDKQDAVPMQSREQMLDSAIKAGGWDISPCGSCGQPVVCLPDGLPMCESCAVKESNEQ